MNELPSEILDRMPPQSLEAEQGVVGSIILDPRVVDDVAAVVAVQDFYAQANRRLYGHLLALHEERKPIDVGLLVERLKASGDFETTGGAAYLAEVVQAVPVAAHAVYYAETVHSKAILREVIQAAQDMLRAAWEPGAEARAVLDLAEARLAEIHAGTVSTEAVPVRTSVVEGLALVDEIISKQKGSGVLTGLTDFDVQVGGFFGSELSIVAARPGQGKTAFAYQVAHWMGSHGHRVLFTSIEMAAAQLALRQVCSLSGVPLRRVRLGTITANDSRAMMRGGEETAAATIWIQDCSRMTPYDIRRTARHVHADVVFVDYLQLVKPINERLKRHEQVGEMTRALRQLAREMKIPVIVLAQLNRRVDDNNRPRRPRLSDLKESGDIEQDADVVVFIHRPGTQIKGTIANGRMGQTWDADLIVEKNRQGPTCNLPVNWNGERTRFVDLDGGMF